VRIGLFGGTFDPPHVGHLLVASDAIEALELDRLALIPAATQPLKAGKHVAGALHRLEMVRRLCHGDARFVVDPIEVDRGGLSFTVDTLRTYRQREPSAALFLLIGEDVAGTLPSWREPDAVAELAELIVLTRGGMVAPQAGPGRRIRTRQIDLSSTEIRARVGAGLSIRGYVTDGVREYIEHQSLYRSQDRQASRRENE
jgi:nicotinate-nucleotide adenylyltransferase